MLLIHKKWVVDLRNSFRYIAATTTMVSAFRKIRHGLLRENRISRYMGYAVGEIILVVIGILIALSISNWNQQRIQQGREMTYLSNLQRDMANQLKSIEIQIGFEEKYRDAAQPILAAYYKTEKLPLDTAFWDQLTTLSERKTFIPMDPTYTDLISSGNIAIIENDSLKDALLMYYQEMERVAAIVQNNNSLITDQHFVAIVLRLGYMTRRKVTWHSKEEIAMKIENEYANSRNQRLIGLATDVLSDPQNELLMVNAIHQRYDLALGHIQMMLNLHRQTAGLMMDLKREIQATD